MTRIDFIFVAVIHRASCDSLRLAQVQIMAGSLVSFRFFHFLRRL